MGAYSNADLNCVEKLWVDFLWFLLFRKFLQCRRYGGLQVPQDKSNTFLLIKGGFFLKIEEQDLCNACDIAVHQRIQKLLLDT